MITEKDLQEAIAECKGQRNPNANTCIKLAAFLTIQRELYGSQESEVIPAYSYDPAPEDDMLINYDSGTEFSEVIDGMPQEVLLPVMDELMSTLQVVQPRIYASVLRKLEEKD